MTLISWPIFFALMAAFGCGTAALYRIRKDRTALAWTLLAFCVATLAVMFVYGYLINPYRQPSIVTLGFLGAALALLLIGIALVSFIPSALKTRLPPEAVRALLPESITELTPEQMRELLPVRFRKLPDLEIRVMVLAYLTRVPPATIRTLSPERLSVLLRREIPRSILDPQ
ncbi:MAG TPA: hypothetical protein VMF62_22400 [Acetobacteraceae bacterium]|jgi:hypothetical protein|nr:hypothetical protein [Acetobacteraceae bacterium]